MAIYIQQKSGVNGIYNWFAIAKLVYASNNYGSHGA